MTPATVVLATIPPAFALLVELLNPVSERVIRRSVEKDLAGYENASPAAHDVLINYATSLTSGAVEVSGLAPTFVASVTSGFGVLYEYPNPWLIMAYILVFVGLVLFLLRYLSGQTFVEIDDTCQSLNLFGREIPMPW